ncbi:MAG: hypothetical protein FJY85_25965 [Deltaproteobacteria bacterium]|nr:hypothetical protein [Deltaproteobacteria bacterium]
MKKNGTYFLSVIETDKVKPGAWDPYTYREQKQSETLEHFASLTKVHGQSFRSSAFKFSPIEYRHIHRGTIPVFTLELRISTLGERVCAVGEGCLLFGTMRAYLGNALVTPKAAWVREKSPLIFSVKSEFVEVVPKDGFVYFWWAFLQSPPFLQSLPIGSGGTRPRLDREQLLQTPVEVPLAPVRERIHRNLAAYAERAWRDYTEAEELLNSTIG